MPTRRKPPTLVNATPSRCAASMAKSKADWTEKYPAIASAVSSLGARQAYLDGELCRVRPDGTTSFSAIQDASDAGESDELVFFLFDLLYLDGETIGSAPLIDRKRRLQELLATVPLPLQYTDHQIGHGPEFFLYQGMRVVAGRNRLKAHRCSLHARQSRIVGQNQMPEPGRVRCCRLDRPRGLTTVPRSTLAGVLHPRRPIGLRRSRWRWHQQCGAWATVAPPATACDTRDATGCAAAAYQPSRVAPRSQPGSLGATRACRRGQVSQLDRRQLAAAGDLPRAAGGQAAL
jgi:ATP dependent DNA ligase domain